MFNSLYKNNKLTYKETVLLSEIKKEKVAERVRKSYKKKLNKVQRQLDNTISPKERSKIGYLKYKARQRFNRPPPKIVAKSMVKFSKISNQIISDDKFIKYNKMVKKAFSGRRKMIRNTLSGYSFNNEVKKRIDFSRRPETLTPKEFADLVKSLK